MPLPVSSPVVSSLPLLANMPQSHLYICLVPEEGLVGPRLQILVILLAMMNCSPDVVIPFCASACVNRVDVLIFRILPI